MSPLTDRVAGYVRAQGMIAPGQHVLAAVSGGLDSMCLLNLLAGLRDQLDFELTAANFDHGLRGSQGDDERELVAETCRTLEAGFTSGKTSELKELVSNGANLQAEARRLRYAFLWSEMPIAWDASCWPLVITAMTRRKQCCCASHRAARWSGWRG